MGCMYAECVYVDTDMNMCYFI